MNKVRNSNIEIIRIISMILIVISHYTVFNGIDNSSLQWGINRFILEFCTLGNIGTILFVLITGYFGINNKFKMKKLFLLIVQVLFYTIIIYLILLLLGVFKFNGTDLIRSIFPVTFKTYWFITAYIVLYIFSPFINKFLNSLTKKEFKIFLGVGLLIFSLLATITTKDFYGNELIQFVLFYAIGAYIQKYKSTKYNYKKNNKILVTMVVIIAISIICFDLIGMKIPFFASRSTYFLGRSTITTIILSVTIFNYFVHKKEKDNKIINSISRNVLGVYLISDNFLIRRILWNDILKCDSYVNSNFLIIHMILSTIIVFVVCIIIDYSRLKLIEPIFIKIYDSLSKFIKKNKIYIKIKEKINSV